MILALLACAHRSPPVLEPIFAKPVLRNELAEVAPEPLADNECRRWEPLEAGEPAPCNGTLGPVNGPDGLDALDASRVYLDDARRFLAESYRGTELDRAVAEDVHADDFAALQTCALDLRDAERERDLWQAAAPVVFVGGAAVGGGIVYGLARALLGAR